MQDWRDSQTDVMKNFFARDLSTDSGTVTVAYSAGKKAVAVSAERSVELDLVVLSVTVMGTFDVEAVITYASSLESHQREHPLESTHPLESARYQSPVFKHEPKHCHLPKEFGTGIEKTKQGGCDLGTVLPFSQSCTVQCKSGYQPVKGYNTYGCFQTLNIADLQCELTPKKTIIPLSEVKSLCAPSGTREFCY
jgi:hypothetical protein